jgi:hypothetical protein
MILIWKRGAGGRGGGKKGKNEVGKDEVCGSASTPEENAQT